MRYAVSICLDSFALLSWLQDEAGAAMTEGFLSQATGAHDFQCYVSAINMGEVYYRLSRIHSAAEADRFWEEAQQGHIPLTIVEPTLQRIQQAARLKARYPIAYADAFAAQLAQEKQLPLASGDPELRVLEAHGEITPP